MVLSCQERGGGGYSLPEKKITKNITTAWLCLACTNTHYIIITLCIFSGSSVPYSKFLNIAMKSPKRYDFVF